MFGLMQPEGGCSYKQDPNYRFHRMHYCGVCKAMGNSYGHKTRFLLNYDIVFLAELLSEWSGEDLEKWGGAYQAINQCFTMPKGETPLSLQYAADANLLLSELKIEDHVEDNGRLSWRFARWLYSGSFIKAAKQLEKWGLDIAEIRYWAEQQATRETNAPDKSIDLDAYMQHFAEPTAQLTALVFKQGAIAVGKPELAAAAFDLGYQFGFLAYSLDAFDDVERDAFDRQFNPLLLFYEQNKTLSEEQREEVRNFLYQIQDGSKACLQQLPLDEARVDLYFSRLRSNLAMQLYKERQVQLRFSERVAARWQQARDYAKQLTCDAPNTLATRLRYQMLSVAVFVAPRTPEYMGMGNKDASMFTWMAFLAAFIAAIGLGVVVGKKQKSKKQKRKEKRSAKRLLQQLGSIFNCNNGNGGNCVAQCCAGCCTACACACCESCCESGCDSCTENCNEGDNTWLWILLLVAIIVIGVTVLLIILL